MEIFDLLKAFNDLELRIGIGMIGIASLPSGPAEDDTVIIMDWQCPCTIDLLSSLDMSKYEQFKWIFINDLQEENKNLMFAINLQYVGVGSEIFIITKNCEVDSCNRFSIEKGRFLLNFYIIAFKMSFSQSIKFIVMHHSLMNYMALG